MALISDYLWLLRLEGEGAVSSLLIWADKVKLVELFVLLEAKVAS